VIRTFKRIAAVPRGVWALGFVSMFMDVSSEMVHALLPVFLVTTLGASVALVGLIEGVSEATGSVVKVFSGWLSDRLGERKLLAVVGYGMAALVKPVFPVAGSPLEVLAARFVDRVGKGVRGAPRDALIADLTEPGTRGAAYGLRQSLDTVGAFCGPLLAIALMALYAGDIRAVLTWAVVPAVIAVLLLVVGVEDRVRPGRVARGAPIRWADLKLLGRAYWAVVAIGVIFTLARFSEAFLVLRASDAGMSLMLAPFVLVTMNVAYALVSAPAGSLSDRLDRRVLFGAGLAALVAADLVLAADPTVAGVLGAAALWGVHMGLTQGVMSAWVADAAPDRLRGTAFGLFNLAVGLALFVASALAGLLWSSFGPQVAFLAGSGFAAIALIGVMSARKMRATVCAGDGG
jgi:MFS family permease